MPRIFISYSRRDKRFAERLAGDLRKTGNDVWLDLWKIQAGDSITTAIESGLRRSEFLLAILSPSFVRSRFARQELTTGLVRQFKRRRIKVIPVLLRKCNMPVILTDLHYADFSKGYLFGMSELLRSLGLSPPSHGQIVKREVVQLSFPGTGQRACFRFDRTIEIDEPRNMLTDLYVYSDKKPVNVHVNTGLARVDEWAGRYRISSVFSKALQVNRTIRRVISYELHGVYGDPEDYYYYNMNSSFSYARVDIRFPSIRPCTDFSARFMVDGEQPDRPTVRRTQRRKYIEYRIILSPEVARFRTVLFEWKW